MCISSTARTAESIFGIHTLCFGQRVWFSLLGRCKLPPGWSLTYSVRTALATLATCVCTAVCLGNAGTVAILLAYRTSTSSIDTNLFICALVTTSPTVTIIRIFTHTRTTTQLQSRGTLTDTIRTRLTGLACTIASPTMTGIV